MVSHLIRPLSVLVGALTLAAALFWPGDALADDVQAGLDHFETVPGHTYVDFSANPVPADFFSPGSEPFDGVVNLRGVPLGPGTTDTVVRRLDVAVLPPPLPATDTVPIELVQLSLVSAGPVTVRFQADPPQRWDLWVLPSPAGQPPGQITITHSHQNGGTFDSILPVCPLFVFLNKANNDTRLLDPCAQGAGPIMFEAFDVPWCHNAGRHLVQEPGDNFMPGVNCPPRGRGGGNGKQLTVEQAQLAAHGVLPAQTHPAPLPPPLAEELQTVLDAVGGH
jgi:hypothetical protein